MIFNLSKMRDLLDNFGSIWYYWFRRLAILNLPSIDVPQFWYESDKILQGLDFVIGIASGGQNSCAHSYPFVSN